MANFFTSYTKTAKNEGGYVYDPDDRGGETAFGIARNMWSGWDGWAMVDWHKNSSWPISNIEKTNVLLKDESFMLKVQEFYRQNFWVPIRGNEIKNQLVADSIYDSAVNMGVKKSIQLTQQSLGLQETGRMSDETLDRLNNNA